MAENKYNTPFAIHRPHFYELQYKNKDGEIHIMTGTPKQVINYILNQQL